MTIQIHLPEDSAPVFREAWGDGLDRAVLEAMVIEGYRTRRFGIAQVRRALGLRTRAEAERWLGERGVPMNYSLEDLEADRATLDRIFGKSA